MLGLLMLACGDFIGGSDYRGNSNSGPFPNAGSNSNYNNHGFPSRDFGNSDYRGNSDNRPSIHTHGFPSVGGTTNYHMNPSAGNSDYRGNLDNRPSIYTHGFPTVGENPNFGSNSNTNGYPFQDPYANTQYSRYPNSNMTNSRGSFGGSSFNHPSPGPTNPNQFSQRGSFGDTNMLNGYQSRQILAGFPSFNSLNLGLSRFGSDSNRPDNARNQYGNTYPNRSPNINDTESILDVVKHEGKLKWNQQKECLQKRILIFFPI